MLIILEPHLFGKPDHVRRTAERPSRIATSRYVLSHHNIILGLASNPFHSSHSQGPAVFDLEYREVTVLWAYTWFNCTIIDQNISPGNIELSLFSNFSFEKSDKLKRPDRQTTSNYYDATNTLGEHVPRRNASTTERLQDWTWPWTWPERIDELE